VADDLHGASGGHRRLILKHSDKPRELENGLLVRIPDALTVSRFAMAAAWIAMRNAAPDAHATFAAIAILAAASDFIDGRIARWLGVAREAGGWLDSVADVTFVLAALSSYAAAGEIPWIIPLLIAVSFAQYAADSLWLHRAGAPVRSRLGHWGGILNYALVLAMALGAPMPAMRQQIIALVPAIAIFYIAAIIERALTYRRPRI